MALETPPKVLKARTRALDVTRLCGHGGPISDARMDRAAGSIEADRDAVRRELLEEIRAEAKFHSSPGLCTADEIALAYDLVWDKYTAKSQEQT